VVTVVVPVPVEVVALDTVFVVSVVTGAPRLNRPTLFPLLSTNHIVFVGESKAMPVGALATVGIMNSDIVRSVGFRRPILFAVNSVNHMFPELSTTTPVGTALALKPLNSVNNWPIGSNLTIEFAELEHVNQTKPL